MIVVEKRALNCIKQLLVNWPEKADVLSLLDYALAEYRDYTPAKYDVKMNKIKCTPNEVFDMKMFIDIV